jgi:glutamate dehydrogenase (NAD(P)+)
MTRRYTSEIGIIIGPPADIPAPDVNTNPQIMAWMMDTYSMNTGTTATGVVTGKPIHLGGSPGPRQGHRPWRVRHRARSRAAAEPGSQRRARGRAGLWQCGLVRGRAVCPGRRLVVAAQDHTGSIFNDKGLDMAELIPHVKATWRRGRLQGRREDGQ